MPRKRKAPAPSWPVEWFVVRLGGAEWRVLLSTPDVQPQLVDAEGYCQHDKSTIYVDASLPRDRLPDVFLHELGHALLFHYGIAKSQKWDDDAEERFLSLMSPVLAASMQSAGMLTMPEIPPLPTGK